MKYFKGPRDRVSKWLLFFIQILNFYFFLKSNVHTYVKTSRVTLRHLPPNYYHTDKKPQCHQHVNKYYGHKKLRLLKKIKTQKRRLT